MKIRQGFVSNSSTTSFTIYGCEVERSEDDEDDMDSDSFVEKASAFGLECYNDYDQERFYVGLSPTEIGDDETGRLFKKRAEGKIEEFLGKETECHFITESFRS